MLCVFTLLDNTKITCHTHANTITENDNSICYVLYRPFIPNSFIKISDRDTAFRARVEFKTVRTNLIEVARDIRMTSRYDVRLRAIDSMRTPCLYAYNSTEPVSQYVTCSALKT